MLYYSIYIFGFSDLLTFALARSTDELLKLSETELTRFKFLLSGNYLITLKK